MTDTLKALRTALAARLGVSVSTEVPATRPDQFVTLMRTSGGVNRFTDTPTILIHCWAKPANGQSGEAAAGALAARVIRALIETADEDPYISDINISNKYRNDTADGTPRYSIVCGVTANQP